MTLYREALKEGTARLARAGIDTARLDCEVLISYACGISRAKLLSRLNEKLPNKRYRLYLQYLGSREKRYPLSYITGHKEFMGLDFAVREGILIPRPETELLTESVMNMLSENANVIDLCTGSGAIAVSLAYYLYDAYIYATDISAAACDVARLNAHRLSVDDRVNVLRGDLYKPLPENLKVDAIVGNPPYIKSSDMRGLMPEVQYEPDGALNGGKNGTDFYKRIIEGAPQYLKDGGFIALEIGYDEAGDVEMLMGGEFADIRVIKDMAGLDRVITGRLS